MFRFSLRNLATVITNFLSAIPYVGTVLVELVWGGLDKDELQCGDVLLKMLLNARMSLGVAYELNLNENSNIYVKKANKKRQLAEVISIKNNKISDMNYGKDITKDSYKLASQRLNAGDLKKKEESKDNIYEAYLVGLIEGDGYFYITKNGKYIKYELGLEISRREVKLIYKLKSILGVGEVNYRNRERREMVCLRIRNKKHLKSKILNIFDKYSMCKKKQIDYLIFKNALISGVKYYEDLKEFKRINKPLFTGYQREARIRENNINKDSYEFNVESIIKLDYFSAWLVGFIEAEGCFRIYEERGEDLTASFEISQIKGEKIIYSIKKYLSINKAIYRDKTNNYRLKVSNVRSVENVIKFLKKAPVKLLGNKKIQFLRWLKKLRKIIRYSKRIEIPDRY